jgi:arylsulfatase A-like enzyme
MRALLLLGLPLVSFGLPPPSIVFVLVDDWGHANAGYQRDPSWPGNNETQTPNIDRLARSGLILDRHYVYKLCSPTRSALQTGRNPIHVNVVNSPINQYNLGDPEAGFQGAARSFTGIAEKLRGVGYMTGQCGKWNAGESTANTTSARNVDPKPNLTPLLRATRTAPKRYGTAEANSCWTWL